MEENNKDKNNKDFSIQNIENVEAISDEVKDRVKEASKAEDIPKGINAIESILGSVSWLMTRSPFHKHLFITDLEWLVMPAVALKQMRIFRNKKMPIAYISWAYISEEVEKRLLSGSVKLAPNDWKSGDKIWIIDHVAPFGGGHQFLKIIQEQVFKDKEVNLLRPKKQGKGLEGKLLKDVLAETEKNKQRK